MAFAQMSLELASTFYYCALFAQRRGFRLFPDGRLLQILFISHTLNGWLNIPDRAIHALITSYRKQWLRISLGTALGNSLKSCRLVTLFDYASA